ncbi:MAG: efflux RND transporter periplasmic adaptor subunit [Neisseriaceae bacterium]|nr:efflux RND transporter periplasmic adaptor subunit [Neisseriaceae bacterium]MBP6861784.1 efflux RND transporter periplasmic adaptor subunit [Neisseriaceae bacterium]
MNAKKNTLLIGLFVLVAALIGIGLWASTRPSPVVLQGQMDAEEVDVAAKVAGRVDAVFVKEGDQIKVGDPIMRLDSPEINAKIKQAKAARDAAEAVAQKAENGARPQEIEMAKQNWRRAQAAAELAQKSYQRVDNLAREGLLARQKRDEAYTNYVASRDQATAAKAQYDMAVEGARQEDIAAANAQAKQVDGVVDEAEVAEQEANLKSPVAGEVSKVIAKRGEISPQGVALITVVDLNDQWVVLNVREDHLAHFALGHTFVGTLPALSSADAKTEATFKVYASSALPDFATWRATRNSEGFDLKTFEIKARPTQPIAGMRPGMSVLVTLK